MTDLASGPMPNRASVRSVLLDDASLARAARTTLAAADRATVVVAGVRAGTIGPAGYRVSIRDEDGEPLLILRSDEQFDAVVRDHRLVELIVLPRTAGGLVVHLSGRVSEASAGQHTGAVNAEPSVSVYRFEVRRVAVRCPHAPFRADPSAEREVPLHVYAAHGPDAVAAAIPRTVEHLNDEHGEDLRAWAARHAGIDPHDVIDARLADLRADGVRLVRIDGRGAHDVELPFTPPARDERDLVDHLRRYLLH